MGYSYRHPVNREKKRVQNNAALYLLTVRACVILSCPCPGGGPSPGWRTKSWNRALLWINQVCLRVRVSVCLCVCMSVCLFTYTWCVCTYVRVYEHVIL